jgi:hypothetical protein
VICFRAACILCFKGVNDCRVERLFVEQTAYTPFSCPPMLTKTCLGDTLRTLLVFQLTRAPRFQLISNLFPGMASRRNHGVAMVRAAVDCVEMPCPKFAMPQNRFIDNRALRFVENDRFLQHLLTAPVRQQRFWKLIAFVPLHPASFITWQQVP